MNKTIPLSRNIYMNSCKRSGCLYKAFYHKGSIAVVFAVDDEIIFRLSVNIPECRNMLLNENHFFVRLYNEGLAVNDECFSTGLFDKVGEPFKVRFGLYQVWKITGPPNGPQ